jgi:hypothetical protein
MFCGGEPAWPGPGGNGGGNGRPPGGGKGIPGRGGGIPPTGHCQHHHVRDLLKSAKLTASWRWHSKWWWWHATATRTWEWKWWREARSCHRCLKHWIVRCLSFGGVRIGDRVNHTLSLLMANLCPRSQHRVLVLASSKRGSAYVDSSRRRFEDDCDHCCELFARSWSRV